ncbi:MAG: thioredoxin domain-containing protein, partial [Cyanobacteria bacterium]|nr:thioredoxin domain-containing protein [Cyanobacteriota bacterium]
NVDDHAEVASQYSVRSIPTLIVFKGGQEVDLITGAVPKTTLAHTLDQYLT